MSTVDGRRPSDAAAAAAIDDAKFNNLIYASDETVELLRSELKSRLLRAADVYGAMKEEEGRITRKAEMVDGATTTMNHGGGGGGGGGGGVVLRLLRRIVRKISRTRRVVPMPDDKSTSGGILDSDSFRQMKLEVGEKGAAVIELAEQLSLLNPTPIPTAGFGNYYDGGTGGPATPASDEKSRLSGNWKLRFTTAADASFPETERRGVASTSQVVDAEMGTFTNVVDFERGRLMGFRVVVRGEATSSTDIGLTFESVRILRRSRFPRLLGRFTLRLPSRLIRWFASRGKDGEARSAGPYLRLRYLDEDLRMHTTGEGNWFVQTRIE